MSAAMIKSNEPAEHNGPASGTVLSGHFDEPDSYSVVRPAGSGDWLITYTLGGEGYFHVSGEEHRCQPGDVTLIKPGTPHQYGTVKGMRWHFMWAHFPDHALQANLLPEAKLFNETVMGDSNRNRIYWAFSRLLTDSRERSSYWNELCLSSLSEVLILLARRRKQHFDSRVEDTLNRISQGMREPIKIEELAAAVQLSPSRLSHLFKKSTGLSIIDMLNQMRIRQAALLLEHTDRSLADIAYDVGYQNYNHFINQFHKWQDMSPSGYRKKRR
ncbi:helix-turn-helix domain-containing protein [Paenibacillus dokdonensis]|uniref:helix-turn-helix domain-containing protein n=1 Tax=Paenibacillus dokdonensis TaxID=2567944 RepID=UPI001FECF249|nr:helix-turn-helix domain-containing protein [Paenibacillus dokdonensis]